MPNIDVSHLSFSFSARPLLENVPFTLEDNHRAALVGPNGSGKTTLLRLLRGELTPDSGAVTVGGIQTDSPLCVPEASRTQGTAQDYLDLVLAKPRAMLARFDELAAELADASSSSDFAGEYDQLLTALTSADVWSLESRIEKTLEGLGLKQLVENNLQSPLSTLSPGQVGRLELAGLILVQPPVLILDEPTNHLDASAIDFLTGQVNSWLGPVLIASHDRAFIEDTATVIYDLDIAHWQALVTAEGGNPLPGMYRFAGKYSESLKEKRDAQEKHQALHSAQQHDKRAIRLHRRGSEDIARGGAKLESAEGSARKFFSDRASKTALRRTRNDDQRLKELSMHEVRKPRDYQLKLNLPPIVPGGGLAVSTREAALTGRLQPTTFDLGCGEHLLLTGTNGAGKTTLLRWIASGCPPSSAPHEASGTISVSGRLAIVPQRLPQLGDPYFTEEHWAHGIGELGSGVMHPSLWSTPIQDLSAGNQRRSQIAAATAQQPEILVIDEPTNYLDVAAIEALQAALDAWNGTLIIASHDRWLIEHWQGTRLHLHSAQ